jgi:hypothetical protein
MPNWCQNKINIYGKKEELDKFYSVYNNQIAENKKSFLQILLPVPEGYYDDERWYDWCMENWGSKWAENFEYTNFIFVEDKMLEFSFDTAWTPVCEGYITISKLFPKLLFEYFFNEPGMDFGGYVVFKNGIIDNELYFEKFRKIKLVTNAFISEINWIESLNVDEYIEEFLFGEIEGIYDNNVNILNKVDYTQS